METWGPDEIRRRREAAGLSQSELATLTGRSRRAVSNWETGKAEPRGSNLRILQQHLGDTPATPSVPLDQATDLDLLSTIGGRLADYANRIRDLEAELRRLNGVADDPDAGDQRTRPGPPGGVPMHFLAADAPSARGHHGGSDAAQGNQ